jgi:hypothetical protein
MINETEPDLVAIVGDLGDGTVEELCPAAEPLRDLDSREETYFITGNHEYFVEGTLSWLLWSASVYGRCATRTRQSGVVARLSTWPASTTSPVSHDQTPGFRRRPVGGRLIPTDDSACAPPDMLC